MNYAPLKRSGHLGHALVEHQDGKLIAFYPKCSRDNKGRSAVGWMECKRTGNGSETWGQPQVLAYTNGLFGAGQQAKSGTQRLSAFAQKAVLTDKRDRVVLPHV